MNEMSVDYLELYDNVSPWLDSTCDKRGYGWFIPGECENGHRFAKQVACGKEFCSVCGKNGSVAHNRRFLRWLHKIFQIEIMGYFVFTIPENLRAEYRTNQALAKLGHDIQSMLKSFGFSKGLRRWHWFGDTPGVWHPHLNCLVEGGFLSSDKLSAIKLAYASILGVDLADVHYQYRLSPGRKVHTLKYVCRSTFLKYEWDPEMALELRGFRNMVVWGRGLWDGKLAWSISDLERKTGTENENGYMNVQAINSLTSGVCPVCNKNVKWRNALPIALLNIIEKHPLGAGYFQLTDLTPPLRKS